MPSVIQNLLAHGGWSNKEQFNDVWIFDVVTRRWEELVWDEEAPSGPARWSHGAVVINAIPDPQLYIWGGLTGALSTGKKPSGTYMNDTRLYNITNQTWKELPFQKISWTMRYSFNISPENWELLCFWRLVK